MSVLLYVCTSRTLTKTLKKKNRNKLDKDDVCGSKWTLKEELYKTTAVRPLTSHHSNYPNNSSKTCLEMLDKMKGPIHKWHSLMTAYIWTLGWPPTIYFPQRCADTGCHLNYSQRAIDYRARWQERERGVDYMCVCVCVCVCVCFLTGRLPEYNLQSSISWPSTEFGITTYKTNPETQWKTERYFLWIKIHSMYHFKITSLLSTILIRARAGLILRDLTWCKWDLWR